MSRQPARSSGAPTQAITTGRQNEYFVDRDGIDREVISADICRYLGNDALVRPGHYENPQTGQLVQGYFVTAYRNLTSAMIEDLKADSARWESERRAQTSRNTPGVQYRYSETHQSRQHHGPTEPPYQPESYPRDSFDAPRYPGSGAPGYTGASNNYQPPPQQQQQQQQQQQPYGAPSGGTFNTVYRESQQPPAPDLMRYASNQAGLMMRPAFHTAQDAPFVGTGANLPQTGFAASNDPYSSRMGSSAAGPPQPIYPTAAPPQPSYPAAAPQYAPFQSQAPPPVATGGHSYSSMQQPHDPFYGRASPGGPVPSHHQPHQPQTVFAAQGQQHFDEPRGPPRPSASAARNQTPVPVPVHSDRDSDRSQHRTARR
ncbi:hypothetical protein E4U22_008497 [Claviceps purpurea]|uniref:Transcription factor RfeG n=1 Tax=Claviceps aff. purpurea TaxID=1967640 RepID=A0A9P7QBW3_9HYPO|nr:hypothetical protein E4U12_004758 [Claviceps purpurea]KAG6284380.1 hypothetical protein E4U46_007165 [Claviceps purpurea]KAG6288414.1 hypothetical protein E4U09_005575 [Claviceps aff. purpurea]KAG6314757.1 hypothetical protein E4U22_008497 [Claviceps purpurea]